MSSTYHERSRASQRRSQVAAYIESRSVDIGHVDWLVIAIATTAIAIIAIGEPELEERQASSTKWMLNELNWVNSN